MMLNSTDSEDKRGNHMFFFFLQQSPTLHSTNAAQINGISAVTRLIAPLGTLNIYTRQYGDLT